MSAGAIVLVHGAWHGGWCWDRVRPALEAAGFALFTPTLPGLQQRADAATPPGLDDHIAAVTAVIDDAPGMVLLVGHSYGGMVVTGAADRRPDRLARVVYLDAAVPQHGQNFAAHVPGLGAKGIARREREFRRMAGGTGWLPVPAPEKLGVDAPADRRWLAGLLRPHPLRSWLEPVHLSADRLRHIPRTFVVARRPPTALTGNLLHAAAAKSSPGWQCREIDAGHEMMVTEPARTAGLILDAARQ